MNLNFIQGSLKFRLPQEEPLKINIPHLAAAAFYVSEANLLSKHVIFLKKSAVHLLDNDVVSHTEKVSHKRYLIFSIFIFK